MFGMYSCRFRNDTHHKRNTTFSSEIKAGTSPNLDLQIQLVERTVEFSLKSRFTSIVRDGELASEKGRINDSVDVSSHSGDCIAAKFDEILCGETARRGETRPLRH